MDSSRTELENLLTGHWQIGWLERIDCGGGWDSLISSFHHEAKKIDPNYRILQIKEKFGGLRIYFDTESKSAGIALRLLATRTERQSYDVCELTGQAGRLMRRNGIFRTLADKFADEGWIPV